MARRFGRATAFFTRVADTAGETLDFTRQRGAMRHPFEQNRAIYGNPAQSFWDANPT
jgi:hypothetical protein